MEYPTVLETLQQQGLKSLYFNSGAFGFPADVATTSRGWVGPADPSIREGVLPIVRQVEEPHAARLSALLVRAWRELTLGNAWIMPKSHWAFELEFGSRDWLAPVLVKTGIDPEMLRPLNNAAAIEFAADEFDLFAVLIEQLLGNLIASDFQLVFPGKTTICTIHSRAQLWWTTADLTVLAGLDLIVPINRDGVA